MRDADSRTFWTAGNKSAMRMAIIAITTSNSMSVNAERRRREAAIRENTGRLLIRRDGRKSGPADRGRTGRACARAQLEGTAGPVAWVRGTERSATGRSSDLRLITSLAKPSRDALSQWRRGRETLTEYSSGPVPDSHRLPFSSHRAES